MEYEERYDGLVPIAKARPRFTRDGRTYTPARTAFYERQIRRGYQGPCFHEAVELNCVFGMKIPKSASKSDREKMLRGDMPHCKKPDIDNLCKSVQDALNGTAYDDDSHIVALTAKKVYSEEPFVKITIWGRN